MLDTLNSFASKNASLIIFASIVAGLLSDAPSKIPDSILAIGLFCELFVACFKIRLEDIRAIRIKTAIVFFFFRYIILGMPLYFLGSLYSESLGVVLLLFALLPTGVTSPGLGGLFGANVALIISLVVLSSLLSPFYIPLILGQLAGAAVKIDSTQMLITILWIVVLPIVVHLPLRRFPNFSKKVAEYNPMLILPMIFTLTLIPVSRYRHHIFDNIAQASVEIIGFLLLYLLFLLFGFLLADRQGRDCRRAYGISSCIHNVTLGVVLALLYLPKEVSTLMVMANISLVLMISLLRGLLRQFERVS